MTTGLHGLVGPRGYLDEGRDAECLGVPDDMRGPLRRVGLPGEVADRRVELV